ncbi:MAG: DUF3320 domain-containing protein [Chitinophagaceae bacterium]
MSGAPSVLSFEYIPSINFALQQNHVPVIRELLLQNTTDTDWQQVSVSISTEPGFSLPWTQTVELIRSGESHSLRKFPLRLSPEFLAGLTEKISGHIVVTVESEGQELIREHYPVDLLAYDQWPGIGILPEMTAAFITPNHPGISTIIRRAADILSAWTGSPSFDEYQTRNPDRVRKQMAAIFEAIAEKSLVYCSVPASFEAQGQRVRLADAVFSQQLANCFDLSLLFAACLEAVGIHSLIIIVKGHAFAGGWLVDESFPDSVNDDVSLLTKRLAEGISEIAVVEATCMNAGHTASFDEACRLAEQKLVEENEFLLFLDVKRARFSNIRPLPQRIATPNGWEIKDAHEASANRSNLRPEEIAVAEKLEVVEKIEVTKQRLWERKLLDLTLRNTLLNVRITKSMIQFLTTDPSKLEDAIAHGEEFQLLPRPTDWDGGIRDTGLYQMLHRADPLAELVQNELSHHRIRTYLSESELFHALTNVYRSSRLAIEENGANTLYIGLGMLRWYETNASERPRYAPILLVPVEIIRKTAQKGFIVRGREEETLMNITLLEMLRQDFGITIGGLENLPRDEKGVDVKRVFNVIRQAIMSISKWDVEEQAVLGTFSFSKFILWNDIHHNADKLCANKIVASLMSGKLEWQEPDDTGDHHIQDNALHPAEIALPISTDSSQLTAVVNAAKEKSFVLHGPPGTGKSQTITNIIANALHAGKRVLFVAAKKAALDVVESRLEAIGIGPFCLELHSNKAKKTAVIEQLKNAAQVVMKTPPEHFQQEADRLLALRNELNQYVAELHRKQPFGYSLYDLFTEYSQLPKGPDHVAFPTALLDTLTPAILVDLQELAEELQTLAGVIGAPQTHPLRAITLQQYSGSIKQELKELIESYADLLSKTAQQLPPILRIAGMEGMDIPATDALPKLAGLLIALPDTPPSLLLVDTPEQTLAQVTGVAAHGKKRDALRSNLLTEYRQEILQLPGEQLLAEWNLASTKWFLPRWLKQNALMKQWRLLSKGKQISKEEVPALLQTVIEYQEEQAVINQASWLPPVLGFLWKNGEPDWDTVTRACETLIEMNRTAAALIGTPLLKEWRGKLAGFWSEGSRTHTSNHEKQLQAFRSLSMEWEAEAGKLQQVLGADMRSLHSTEAGRRTAATETKLWLENLDALKDWYNWTSTRQRATAAGLLPLVSAFENGHIGSGDMVAQFRKGFARSAAEYIIHRSPQLATFNGTLFSEKIRRFREISQRFEQLTRQEMYARLAARVPNFTQEASQSSEIGFLQRAIRNNGRALSIRKLFDSIPHLLPRITPCMLMSPISVAQYFDADGPKFDLVIFDEASQMPTCEAIGAIARGTQLIVVGDPKQMPPTSFFSTNNVDEENIEMEDLESILDDCLALSMPSRHLLWHYRSKHESLIAFSNANYYENKLLTFPSTDDINSKVRHVPVTGFYDKSKTRQNMAEAKAIVEEVVRRLSDPVLSTKSIGIVTFSSVQQLLIDDLLTDVFALRPDLEKKATDSHEPLFIKNLENVQGDERDVILFSVGYGPDKDGKVSLNFGPINRDGGWRRLNVAVSRARYEMKVFSTLRSDQIDLNRTSSEGVAGLKAFLAYAEKGKAALPRSAANQQATTASLEDAIAQELRTHGYEVHTHIGSSAFRIDIGIVDKRNPANYILAILTDGKNYFNALTSKDREIVQVGVLQALGWNIHKIWSTEWWDNPTKVIQGVMEAIRDAEAGKVAVVAPEPGALPAEASPVETPPAPFDATPIPETTVLLYTPCILEPVTGASYEDFLLPASQPRITAQLRLVLEAEAPVSKSLAYKRVLAAWGISKLGSRISSRLDQLLEEIEITTTGYNGNTYLWTGGASPANYTGFRSASSDLFKRDADDLPPEEVANCVKDILQNQISLTKADLIRETAKAFGYTRTGGNLEKAMTAGIEKALERGDAVLKEDRVVGKS